jgi:uncharacterized protein (DUF58 family)
MLKTFLTRWIFFLLIAVSSLIIGLRTSVGFFLFFFWFLAATAALTFISFCLPFFLSRLTVRTRYLSRIDEDELIDMRVEVRNTGLLPLFNTILRFPLPFFSPESQHKNLHLEFLMPRGSTEIVYRDVCYKRGRYIFGDGAAYFFDPFGIFFFKRPLNQKLELYVYPHIFPVKEFPPLVKGNLPWFGVSAARSYADEEDFYGIREYKPGDPLKTIHWMSTARHRKLIVKQFQRLSFFRASMLFNLEKDSNYGEGKEAVCEYIIRIAASLAKYLIDRKVSLEIIAHVGEIVHIEPNKGPEHLEEILKFLTIAEPESRVGLGELVEEFSAYIPEDSNLIVIMLDKDWDRFLSAIAVDKPGVSLIPIVLVSSSFLHRDGKIDEYAQDLKVKLYRKFNFNPIVVSCGDRMEEIFSEI